MKNTANIITIGRIIGSAVLIFVQTFSVWFYIVYIFCGLTDIADGAVARLTGTQSKLGSVLDSIADIVFAVVCLIKLLPCITLFAWQWLLILIIALIRIANIVAGIIISGKAVFLHTIANKITGLCLFILVFTLNTDYWDYAVIIVCAAAAFASIQEGLLILKGRQ